jgi:ribosomal protein S18 acetylase RimI-like enzyme
VSTKASPSDTALYETMHGSMVAAWRVVADGSEKASVIEVPGAIVALFPVGAERAFYNNAVLDRGLDSRAAGAAREAIAAIYGDAGIRDYATWVHEHDEHANAEMRRRGLKLGEITRGMAMPLENLSTPIPDADFGPPDWDEYLRVVELSEGTYAGLDPAAFEIVIARLDGKSASAGMSLDHGDDCGIFSLGTLAHARRRGLGTAVTTRLLHDARRRGCSTASIQATAMAVGVYTAIGFRDLGAFNEYV